jgi:hypothetical protein
MQPSPCSKDGRSSEKFIVGKRKHFMNRIFANTLRTLALAFALAASVHSAQATAVAHTYVSSAGSDGNPCSRISPCATFQGALANTVPGGVITALNAADYGQVNIAQSVTIDGTGTEASIVTNTVPYAITINGASSDMIILRHLAITGLPTSDHGVLLNTGNLVVDDCKISGFQGYYGLKFAGSGNVVVKNTTVTGCHYALYNQDAGLLSVWNVTLQGNQYGVVTGAGLLDISHSQITQNSIDGLYAYQSTLSASDCMVSGDRTAVYADTGSIIRLTNNDILNNGTGIDATSGGGTVSTSGDNRKAGNTMSGNVTPGNVITQQ